MALRRVASEWAIPVGPACVVVAFAGGSSSEQGIKHFASHARWVVLVAVCAGALFVAARQLWTTRSLPPRGLLRFGVLTAAFLAVAVVSTGWSVSPRLTFERSVSLGILFTLGAALASITAADVGARVRLFQGLAAGAIVVGLLGIVVAAVDYNAAVLAGSATSSARYRGFTENPNTIAILAGAVLPILVALAIRAQSRRAQAAWLAGGLLMLGSIVAAESRGGLLAACAGTLVVAAFGVDGARRRVVSVVALLAVFAGGTALRQVAQPPAPTFSTEVAKTPRSALKADQRANRATVRKGTHAKRPTRPRGKSARGTGTGTKTQHGRTKHGKGTVTPKVKHARHRHRHKPRPFLVPDTKPQVLPNEQDEIGHPLLSKSATSTVASGRLAAWKGALELIRDRPIVGYGFGTETKVFIDRWYYFQGNSPENSFLGLLLQLGVVGLALLAVIGLALAAGGVRALRVVHDDERVLVLAGLGILVAAAGIMIIQSYLYSVGNIATATVWISLFVLGAAALEPRPAPARVSPATQKAAA